MGNCSTQASQSFFKTNYNTLVLGRKYQNVLVQITRGNYFREQVDVLVIPLKSKEIQLNNDDVREIMGIVGSKVKNELNSQEFDEDNIIITSGGNLECSRILFVLLKGDKQPNTQQNQFSQSENPLVQVSANGVPFQQSIYTAMKKSLIRAKSINALSIAFPCIKEKHFQTSEIATIMLITIKEFLEEETDKGLLQTVTISLEDEDTVNTFKWTINRFFQKRFSSGSTGLASTFLVQRTDSEFEQSSQIKSLKVVDFDEL